MIPRIGERRMTPHDTPEAVERHAEHVASCDLPETAAMLRRLHKRAVDAERERDGATDLIERMQAHDVTAIQAWHKAHPGNDLLWPSNIRLTAWCMGEIARLVAERDIYRGNCTDALAENDALRFERNNLRTMLATAREAAAWAAGAEAMREMAEASADCGCDVRAIVLERLASHGLREAERCCGQHYDACCALTAAAIRTLPIPPMPTQGGNVDE